jgi:hypothetical protein
MSTKPAISIEPDIVQHEGALVRTILPLVAIAGFIGKRGSADIDPGYLIPFVPHALGELACQSTAMLRVACVVEHHNSKAISWDGPLLWVFARNFICESSHGSDPHFSRRRLHVACHPDAPHYLSDDSQIQ